MTKIAEPRILFFAKAPVKGQVKTRLNSAVGEQRALTLYKEALEFTLRELVLSEVPITFFVDVQDSWLMSIAETVAADFRLQDEGDLGLRMERAAQWALANGDLPILIGADCVSIRSGDIKQAVRALDDHDVVLKPAEDGGYMLLAVTNNFPELFQGHQWGHDSVLATTVSALELNTRSIELLPMGWDFDRLEDIARFEALRRREDK